MINCFLAGTKTGLIRDSLPFSPFLCIYFLTKKLVSYRDEIWADVSVLLRIFFFLFGFLCSVFLLVNCFVFLGFFVAVGCCELLCFCPLSSLSSRFSSPFYRLPSWLPLTSPAFAGLLSSTNEIVGERRGPRLDRIRCRFSACWIGMEKTNTTVLPAVTTFRQQWIPPATATFQAAMDIFILTPELWKFGNWTSKN